MPIELTTIEWVIWGGLLVLACSLSTCAFGYHMGKEKVYMDLDHEAQRRELEQGPVVQG